MSISVVTGLTVSKGLVQSGTSATSFSSSEISAGYQPLDATLTALAGATIASNTLLVGSGVDAFTVQAFAANTFPARASTGSLTAKTITDFGLSLVDDANAAAALATLGGTTVGANFFSLTNPSAITFVRINADNTVSALSASAYRTAIGATTVGANFFTVANPGAIRFARVNADNTVDLLSDSDFRTAIGAGTGSGTVTSVALALPSIFDVSGSPVTGSGTLTGALATQTANTIFAGPTTGSAAAPTFRAMVAADVPAVIDATKLATSVPAFGWSAPINLAFTTSTLSNAMTIAVKGADGNDASATNPILFAFRAPVLSTGTPVIRTLTAALSLTISAGSTLGITSGDPHKFWLVVFDDGGTLRLGIINCVVLTAGACRIYPLREDGVASSTAEGGAGAADSAGVFYTGTAVTSKAFKVIGYIDFNAGLNATAGNWVDTPTVSQVFGPGVRLPGHPVQTIQFQTSTGFSTTSSTPQTTTITQAITPTSQCNLVMIQHSGQFEADGINKVGLVRTYRDSTTIGAIQGIYIAQSLTVVPCAQALLDALKSSSSVTYSAKLSSSDNTTTMHYPAATLGSAPYGQMTLTEISA